MHWGAQTLDSNFGDTRHWDFIAHRCWCRDGQGTSFVLRCRDPRLRPSLAVLLAGQCRAADSSGKVFSFPPCWRSRGDNCRKCFKGRPFSLLWRMNFFLTLFFLCAHLKPSRPFQELFCWRYNSKGNYSIQYWPLPPRIYKSSMTLPVWQGWDAGDFKDTGLWSRIALQALHSSAASVCLLLQELWSVASPRRV